MARKAFLMGVNTFDLRYAESDASRMAEALRALTWDTEVALPAGKHRLRTSFDQFLRSCKPEDTVLLYYSGHAVLRAGRLHFVIEKSVPHQELLAFDDLRDPLNECRAKYKLAVLDCCHAGAGEQRLTIDKDPSFRLLAASERLEESKELEHLEGGFLTHRLARALSTYVPDIPLVGHELRLNAIYEWLKVQAEEYNQAKRGQVVPIPNLIGNQKYDVTLGTVVAPKSEAVVRPSVGGLPTFSQNDPVRSQFVGREEFLEDVYGALDGLVERAEGKKSSPRGRKVQLVWLHGFGGMGKTWFLRKIALEAASRQPTVRVALIDWDSPRWKEPLGDFDPSIPEQVFSTIAYRLSQLYGPAALDEYWRAKETVKKYREERETLEYQFDDALDALRKEDRSPEEPIGSIETQCQLSDSGKRARVSLRTTLRDAGLWSRDPDERQKLLVSVDGDPRRRASVFASWATEKAMHNAAVDPQRVLGTALRECARLVAKERPLLLILDTCEVLSLELEDQLRQVLAPLTDPSVFLLSLIASRRRPGAKWLLEIPRVNLYLVPFDEAVCFTAKEVEEAVARSNASRNIAALAHRATGGLPLAVQVVLDMCDDGGSVIEKLLRAEVRAGGEDGPAVRVIEMTEVVREVSDRFLRHLQRMGRQKDLRDIVALSLLDKVDRVSLEALWGESFASRIRALRTRYSLIGGNEDLHPTVREYLRARWRSEPSPEVGEIASELLEIIERQEPDRPRVALEQCEWTERWLNMASWVRRDEAMSKALEGFLVHMTFERSTIRLERLLRELVSQAPQEDGAHEAFISWLDGPAIERSVLKKGVLQYLMENVVDQSSRWTEGAFEFWKAWQLAEQHTWTVKYRTEDRKRVKSAVVELARACGHFERAVELFEELPRASQLARVYIKAAFYVGLHQPERRSITERAYSWSKKHGTVSDALWFERAGLLHNLGWYREAEDAYRRAIDERELRFEDKEMAYRGLVHCRQDHLDDSATAAAAAREALRNGLGEPFYEWLVKALKSERKYRAAVEVLHEELSAAWGRRAEQVQLEIAETLRWELDSGGEAEAHYREVLRRDARNVRAAMGLAACGGGEDAATVVREVMQKAEGISGDELNNIAWAYYLKGEQLDGAEMLAQRACEVGEEESEAVRAERVHTLACILVRRGSWRDAARFVRRWLEWVTLASLRARWKGYVMLFQEAVRQGCHEELARVIEEGKLGGCWIAVAWALRYARGSGEPEGLSREFAEMAREFRRQFGAEGEEKMEFPARSLLE